MVAAWMPRRNRRDQRRRRVRARVAAHVRARRARSLSVSRATPISAPATSRSRSSAGGFSLRFTLRCAGGQSARCDLQLAGRHNVVNALAAAAAASAAGASAGRHRRGPREVRAVDGRLQLKAAPRRAGSSTIRTTPIPVRCAPRSTCCEELDGPRWLVLGDMARARRLRAAEPSRCGSAGARSGCRGCSRWAR